MLHAGDMYYAPYRCDTIRECYLFMEKQKEDENARKTPK